MRFIIIISNIFLLIFSAFIFAFNKQKTSSTITNKHKQTEQRITSKKILIKVAIKHNIPIKKALNLKKEYYLSTKQAEVFLFTIINYLQLDPDCFDFNEIDLSQIIKSDYELVLVAKPKAIQFYHRYHVFLDLFLSIGLTISDAKKVLTVLHNEKLRKNEVETQLKAILLTKKRYFFHIINSFVIY